jgi:hypothetical protein
MMRSRRLRAALTTLAVLPALLCTTPGGAQTVTRQLSYQTKLCATAPYVYYINGIWGQSDEEEHRSANFIQQAMTGAGEADAAPVASIFNQSEGHALDIFRKLLLQKAQETSSSATLASPRKVNRMTSQVPTRPPSRADWLLAPPQS